MHQFGIIKKCLDTVDARYKHEDIMQLFQLNKKNSSNLPLPPFDFVFARMCNEYRHFFFFHF